MIGQLLAATPPSMRGRLRRALVGIVAGAVLQGLAFVAVVPLVRALLEGDRADAWRWLIVLAAVALSSAALHYVSQLWALRAAVALIRSLQQDLGDHVARLPLGWFDQTRSGRLARIGTQGVTDVAGALAHLLRPAIAGIVTPVVVALAMFAFDWRMALAATLTAPALALVYRWTTRLFAATDHATDAAAADATGRVLEFAQAQAVLRGSGRSAHHGALLDRALVAQRDAQRRQIGAVAPSLTAFSLSVQLTFTVLLVLGVALALGDSIGAAPLLALLVLAARFVDPMLAAVASGSALRLSRNALARIVEVLGEPTLPGPPGDATPRDGALALEHVSFAYGDAPALRDVSIEVPERSMTALVGASGSGKTTILRLLARFWDVQEGSVRVGGVDVRELAEEALMAQLAPVFQDVYLFDATIADNVRIGRPDASEQELEWAAGIARVREIVDRLPGGWQTPVGEGGARLSGGERQRVAIARALLKDAPIVLLDEATAALDPVNEAAISDALSELRERRTIVVVAHRLASIVAADQIVVLDAGRVVAVGDHESLLAAGGRYAELWRERSRAAGWRIAAAAGRER